jgi:hypothetical protein
MGLKIEIQTIPHKEQVYETVGDYRLKDDTLMIYVSDLSNWKEEILIAIHKLIEYAMVLDIGIPLKEIDKFDMEFKGEGEPGDDENSPYYIEHQRATIVEKLMADWLGVDWKKYDEHIAKLDWNNSE